jgi:hypothetical protein
MSTLVIVLIVLLVLAVFGGAWNNSTVGWSPVGVILLILLILFLTGNLKPLHL